MTPFSKMMLSTAAIVGATVLVASGVSRAQYYGDGFGSFQNPITGAPNTWDEMNHNRMRMELQMLQFQQQMESLNAQREFYRIQQEQAELKRLQDQQRHEKFHQNAVREAERNSSGGR